MYNVLLPSWTALWYWLMGCVAGLLSICARVRTGGLCARQPGLSRSTEGRPYLALDASLSGRVQVSSPALLPPPPPFLALESPMKIAFLRLVYLLRRTQFAFEERLNNLDSTLPQEVFPPPLPPPPPTPGSQIESSIPHPLKRALQIIHELNGFKVAK